MVRLAALVLIAMVACTDEDGPPIQHGNVTVHVVRDEQPVDAAPVVFHDATGHVLGTARTDANGLATGEITTWGMVTVLDPALPQQPTTIVRVSLGATLEIPLEAALPPGPLVDSLAIAAPTTAPPPDTASYYIQTPCGNQEVGSLPATVSLPAGCSADLPVVIIARTPMQSFEDPGIALAYVAGYAADRAFQPGAWSTTCTSVALDADTEMQLQLWPRLGGQPFRYLDLGFCPVSPPVRPTLDFGEGAVLHAFGYIDGSPLRTTSVLRDFATLPSTVHVATSDGLAGDIAVTRFDGAGAQWTSDPALQDVDAIDAKLTWGLGPDYYVVWRFVLPPDAPGMFVPQIPDELRNWSPLDGAREVFAQLRYVDASWLHDLAALHRELPLILDGAASRREVPRGSTLRDFVETIYPDQAP